MARRDSRRHGRCRPDVHPSARNHPWFELAEVAASERSEGKPYAEAATLARRRDAGRVVASTDRVNGCDPAAHSFARLCFRRSTRASPAMSSAHSPRQGRFVLSNAKNFRMEADVPLVIPEVNASITFSSSIAQRKERGWKGAIVTNANCAATVAAVALAPLHEKFGIDRLFMTTMQAVSGAGYPGVPSLDILGNVIPYIADEEPKLEHEMLKLLGTLRRRRQCRRRRCRSASQTNRVAVEHGHTVCITCLIPKSAYAGAGDRGAPRVEGRRSQRADLPSRPETPLAVTDEPNRPQPRRDVNAGDGMTVTVGTSTRRIRFSTCRWSRSGTTRFAAQRAARC